MDDGRIVDADVEPAIGGDGRPHHGPRLGPVAHVAGHEGGPSAAALDGLGRLPSAVLVDVGQHHRGALGRKALGDRQPNAPRRAGDDGNLVR